MKLWHSLTPFYFPDEPIGAAPSADLSVLDIIDKLGEDDEVEGNPEDKEGKGDKGLESKANREDKNDKGEENEEEIELEEITDDEVKDDDIEDVVNPLSRKELLKTYPDLFKKFPQLEKGYYASQKYRELFPTLEDAREANERLETFSNIEKELNDGNSEGLFKNLRESNPNSFAKMVDNYLPQLGNIDQNAYYHVIGNVLKTTVARMGRMAASKKDDDLLTAARILNEWAFGEEEFTPPQRFAPEEDKGKSELEKEREEYANSKLADNQAEVKAKVNQTIEATVEKFIDPNEKLTAFAKKAAIREAVDKTNELLASDRELKKLNERLWKTAKDSKYSPETVGKIRRATQERAKAILPQVIKKVRADALRGVERRSSSDTTDRKGKLPNGAGNKSASRNDNSGSKGNEKSKIPSGMSTYDFLSSD